MGTITLRPSADIGTAGVAPSLQGGAPSYASAASDNADVTAFRFSGANFQHVRVAMTDMALPANAQIRSVVPSLRHDNFDLGMGSGFAFGTPGVGDFALDALLRVRTSGAANTGAYAHQTGTARATNMAGAPWSLADVNALTMLVQTNSNVQGFWVSELYLVVTTNEAPTATATGPGGTQSTTRPTCTWTYSDPEGDAQERFRVRGFSAAQYSAVGFDPNTTTPAFDSGEVFSSATSWQVNTDLQNGTNYRFFIQVADAGSGGRYSTMSAAGPYMTFVIGLNAPAVPEIASVTTDPTLNLHTLTLVDRQNVLTDAQASFESGLGGWLNTANSTVAQLGGQSAFDGAGVLDFRSVNSGSATAVSSTPAAGFPVVPGRRYSAMAYFAPVALASGRSCYVGIEWYNAANAFMGGTAVGPSITEVVGAFTPAFVTGVAPANAVRAVMFVAITTTAANERHFIDGAALVPYAINQLANPAFELDTNNDGLGDNWLTYNWNGSDPAAIYYLQPAAPYVFGGSVSQQIGWAVNTGWKGIYQQGITLKSGVQYTASAWVRVDNAAGVQVMVDPPGTGAAVVAVPAKTWTRITHTFTAGADTTNAMLFVRSSTPGANTLWVGHVQLELASTPSAPVLNQRPWPRGGFISAQRFEVQRSDDGGATWKSLSRLVFNPAQYSPIDVDALGGINVNDVSQSITAFDYEAPRLTTPLYRVRSAGKINNNNIASSWSVRVTGPSLPATGWILKSLTDPSLNMALRVDWGKFTEDEPIDAGVFEPLDADETVVVQGRTRGKVLNLGLRFLDGATFDSFAKLRRRKETLLLQDPNGRQWFIRMTGGRKANEWKYSGGVMVRTLDVTLQEVTV